MRKLNVNAWRQYERQSDDDNTTKLTMTYVMLMVMTIMTNMTITMTLLQALPLLIEDSAGMIESSSSLFSTLNIIYFLLFILNLFNYIKHTEKMTNLLVDMIYFHLPTKSYDWKHRKGKTLSVCSLGSKLLELLTPSYRRSWNNLWYLCFCICVSDWY